MTKLKPNQALFLWRMITGATDSIREPSLSTAIPKLKSDRKSLVDQGYLETEKRGRSTHLLLTDKSWEWAATHLEVELLKSSSPVGAEALEGLLHRLLPFLKRSQIPLAALFMDLPFSAKVPAPSQSDEGAIAVPERRKPDTQEFRQAIEEAYLALSGGHRKVRVLLRDLRPTLPQVPRTNLDEILKSMQRDGKLVLYREDNSAALTPADSEAALLVGDSPRHLIYLED